METGTHQGTAVEAVAAVEAALDVLASGVHRHDPAQRLELIARLRTAAGRATALVAVWVAEADRARDAQTAAGTTVTDWLSRTGHADPKEAAGILNHGRALLETPQLKDAATAGHITPGQARSIGKTMRELPQDLTPAQQQQAMETLLDRAEKMTPAELGRQAKALTAGLAPEHLPDHEARVRLTEQQRHRALQRRRLNFFHDGDGSWRFEGSLPTLEGEKFRRLIAGYVASQQAAAKKQGLRDTRTWEQANADALTELIDTHGAAAKLPGLAGDTSPRIVVTINETDLHNRAEQAGLLPSGHPIDPGTLRRLCCDAEIIPIILDGNSAILDAGEAVRTVTPDIRLALTIRDGGCRFPGCDVPDENCEAHHINPWWAGGATSLENSVLLCKYHHSLIEPPRLWTDPTPNRWAITITDGQPQFQPPGGPAPP